MSEYTEKIRLSGIAAAAALYIGLTAVSAAGFRISASAGDVDFSRGSGYRAIQVTEYPQFAPVYSQEREVEAFATFDEKAAYFRNTEADHIEKDTDTIFVSCREYNIDASRILLTHILIRDPSQLHIGLSYDTFGGECERPSDYAKRTGDVVVVNGSYFYYDTGKPIDVCARVVLNDGEVLRGGTTNGSEICLRSDGTFFSPHPLIAFTPENLISIGVISDIGTADPLLIQDAAPMSFPDGVRNMPYPTTALGVVFPGEYYIITAGKDGSYDGGLTYGQLQTIFYYLGCDYARSCDGGGSAALVINGELKNVPAEGKERAVVDFVCFSE